MNKEKYNEDDYCDIYSNKICDNCGKCLEEQGVDVRAINIEDIAKTVEENEYLEEAFKLALEEAKEEKTLEVNSNEVYTTAEEFLKDVEGTDYVDAFDHIEYIEDLEIMNQSDIEDLTEEIFPGVRKLKK